MTLFSIPTSKSARPAPDLRPRRRIPTGVPRLVPPSRERGVATRSVAWRALLDAVRQSSTARIEALSGRSGGDQIPCCWRQLTGCGSDCRCGGRGTVRIDFLREHYARLAEDILESARPAVIRQRSQSVAGEGRP